jgi:hypothetical protein
LFALGASARPEARKSEPKSSPVVPASPLRFIPAEADLVLQVPSPRRAAETAVTLDTLQKLQTFSVVRELLDGTQARRGKQFLAYFEKEMGCKWPELLDRVAGRGIALGAKFGDKAPALLAIQGTDEAAVKKFVKTALAVAQAELDRQETGVKIARREYKGSEAASIGPDLHIARVGPVVLLSNKQEALKRALDIQDGGKSAADLPAVGEALRLLPKAPLVSLYIDMKVAHASPQGKALYKSPRDDVVQTFAIGSLLDVLGRTPYVVVGVCQEKDGFLTTVRAPRGRAGMGGDRLLHLPAEEGMPGSRPLLEPKGVLFSQSFYFDLANMWNEREKLFPKKVADDIAKGDKNTGRFLGGAKLSDLYTQTAPYKRVIVVNQPKAGYKRQPKQRIPAFAVVTELRQPEKFGRAMDTVLRGAALLATTQVKLKLTEETHAGVEITGYRFDEKAPLKNDVNDIRFNFSPCYCQVGNQYVFCSTIELARELVGLLQKEQKSPPTGQRASSLIRLYGAGGAAALKDTEDQLITQVILDQAVPPGEAREQVEAFITLVRQFGSLSLSANYHEREFRYEIRSGK